MMSGVFSAVILYGLLKPVSRNLALAALACDCYLTNSVVNFLPAGVGESLFPWILLPCLLAVGAPALWLCIAGVNPSAWMSVAAARRAV